ncbi:restriction endonuclease subunit S [Moraxella lacunata]|uniref:Restriction endonuclease n=1 Tax=Moraxella lacunata TaxID=477 RepID=A0A1V4GQL0_MORLA|nr:restriction endonuclease subunit S [Moraxella lacunata]OPH34907.1 restriction endonuclease [Moraxella lacunata]
MIKKLLQGQAVEWRTLGEVVLPTNNIKWHESDLSYRYIDLSSVDKDNNNIGETLEITSKNAPSRAQKIIKKDDVIFATTRPTQMRSALIPPNLDGQIASTGYCILRANQNEVLPKWIYYNLQINEFKIYLQDKQSGTAYPAISDGLIKQFQIPIPPLSVQSQIVQILDTFTELTAELTAELSMRQKQYQYYRDFLLSEHELAKVGFEWKTLGEVGELIRGNGLTKKDLTDDGVPAIHYGQIYTRYGLSTEKTLSFVSTELAKRLRKVDTGDVVITNTSENLADVGKSLVYLGKEQAVTGGHATIFKPNKQIILGKYFAYFTQTDNFATQKRKYAKGTKVIDVSTNDMAKLKIPIPPLSVQSQIVAILDTFDTLVSSISEGLPKEIQLRQKQYEYYRELLLDFDAGDGV